MGVDKSDRKMSVTVQDADAVEVVEQLDDASQLSAFDLQKAVK